MSEFESYCNLTGIVAETIRARIFPHWSAGFRAGRDAVLEAAPIDPLRARIASEQMVWAHGKAGASVQERAEWAVMNADALLRELAK